jgi:hypothetical protein
VEPMMSMLAQAADVPLLQQGAFQFVLFGLMVIAIYILLKITIAK